jgi:molybdenum cofactor cytidylyltransferase
MPEVISIAPSRAFQSARTISGVIPAIVLAAGLSTRMGGRSKALLPTPDGQSFVTRIVRTFNAAGVDDVVVVIGHEAALVERALGEPDLRVRVVVNPEYRTGQFSSVLAGLNAVDRPGSVGMLMTLVDVPFVTAETVRAVIERFQATRAPIVRPVRGNEHGHPVLVSRALFPLLRAADPAQGAKPLVRSNVSVLGDVEVDDPGAFRDIDTPDEYAQLTVTPPTR